MRLLYDESGRPPKTLTEPELERLYDHPVGPHGRWLRTNFVTTLDGSIYGPDGRSGSINTESDHHLFALQRALADVILVGAGTARAEGYRAVDLAPWQRDLRQRIGLAEFPVLAVVTATLALDPVIAQPVGGVGGSVIIISTDDHDDASTEPFRSAGIDVWQLGRGAVDLPRVIDRLVERGLPRMLCEGGPQLHHGLLSAGLIDELAITLAPTVVGGEAPRTVHGDWLSPAPGFRPDRVLLADDQTLFLGYVAG